MKGLNKTAIWLGVVLAFFLLLNPGSAFAEKPLVLKVSFYTHAPERNVYSRANGWILQEVEKRSNGRIKFEYYYSGSLVPGRETVAGLRDGVADIAFVVSFYEPGKLPLGTVTTLPMLGRNFYSTAMAFRELVQLPEMQAELDKYNIRYLSHCTNSSYTLWTNTPVHSVADLKGKKLRAISGQDKLIKALGAVPVSVVSTELYTALERKTLDGTLANPTFATDYKFQEVCPYYYSMMFGNGTVFLGINKDSWKKIPPDIQQMFDELAEPAARIGHEIYEFEGLKKLKALQKQGVVTITRPTPEDVAYVTRIAKETVWKEWVEKMNEKGLPGQKVLDTYLKLVEKWEARNPFKE